jgi:hypothetical protein
MLFTDRPQAIIGSVASAHTGTRWPPKRSGCARQASRCGSNPRTWRWHVTTESLATVAGATSVAMKSAPAISPIHAETCLSKLMVSAGSMDIAQRRATLIAEAATVEQV